MPPKGPTPSEVAAARKRAYELVTAVAGDLPGKDRARLTVSIRDRLLAGQTEANARAELTAYVQQQAQAEQQAEAQRRQAILSTPLGATSAPAATPPAGAAPGGTARGGKKQLTVAEGYQAYINSLLQNPITPDSYRKEDGSFDAASYTAEQGAWASELTAAMESARQAQQLQMGIIEVPDGQGGTVVLDVHDPAIERDPQLAAQMATYFANQDRELQNKWQMTLHQLELDDYAGTVAQTNLANANASRSFQDALEMVQQRVNIGQANQDTAVKEIARQIQGLAESRARSGEVEDQLSRVQGWGTQGGKTSFSGADLFPGAFRFSGEDLSAPLLNFTGTRQTDPLGMMAQQDAALGVTGQLPSIPGLGVTAADLPAAPGYAGVGARPKAPTLLPPVIPDRTPQLRLTGYNPPEEGGM